MATYQEQSREVEYEAKIDALTMKVNQLQAELDAIKMMNKEILTMMMEIRTSVINTEAATKTAVDGINAAAKSVTSLVTSL